MSSLLNTEERGAAHLVHDRGRVQWRFPDNTEYRGTPACSEPVQLFPDTGRYEVPQPADQLLPYQALYASGFLRTRHAGIDVPSRILAKSIIEDAQECAKQAERGDLTVGRTLAVYPISVRDKQVVLVLCVGGPTRSDLFASELEYGAFTAAGRPVFQSVSPIVQVSVAGEQILVRSIGSTVVGRLQAVRSGYVFHVTYVVQTAKRAKTQHVDALLINNGMAAIDAIGKLQLYDATGKTCVCTNRQSSMCLPGERDPCWHLAWTGDAMLAASSSDVYSIDARVRIY